MTAQNNAEELLPPTPEQKELAKKVCANHIGEPDDYKVITEDSKAKLCFLFFLSEMYRSGVLPETLRSEFANRIGPDFKSFFGDKVLNMPGTKPTLEQLLENADEDLK